ncbi:MAG: ATP-binding protein [Gemmatimonadaceae bacterium]
MSVPVDLVDRASAPGAPTDQQRLVGALGRIRRLLESSIARPEAERLELSADGGKTAEQERSSADVLAARFRLSPFERDLVLLCAGVELDSKIASLCATANGDPMRRYATLSIAMGALPGAHWSALTPDSTIRRWRLVVVPEAGVLTTAPLGLDERVLHFLAGTPHMDQRLTALAEPLPATRTLAPTHQAIVDHVVRLWSAPPSGASVPVVQLVGDSGSDRDGVAAMAARALSIRPYRVRAELLPRSAAELEQLSRLVEREEVLGKYVIVLDCDSLDESDHRQAVTVSRFLERTLGAVFVTGAKRHPTSQRASVSFEIPRTTASEQRIAWGGALGDAASNRDDTIEHLAAHFKLGADAVHSIAAETLARAPFASESEFAAALWSACRLHARPRIEALAQRIESRATMDDLVLPAVQKETLHDIAAQVRHRATVYERWGFGGQGARGLGISVLFAGTSGTGKTMAAEVIGKELGLDVFRIDLSAVVSKYIGETEKNLRRIFDEAEGGGAVLLFDEADALFGKRSDVKDSHDRYANIEVSYLLQRMESYRGLAILTTNMKSALDTAFLRRIRFIVQFPFPDAEQRAEIWRRVFPVETPREGLDPLRLAQLSVSGGNIRSIAMNAAFLAAEDRTPVRMGTVMRAARAEYSKLEKPLTEAELRGWEK